MISAATDGLYVETWNQTKDAGASYRVEKAERVRITRVVDGHAEVAYVAWDDSTWEPKCPT